MQKELFEAQETEGIGETDVDEGRRLILKGLVGCIAALYGGSILTVASTAEARKAIPKDVHGVRRGEYLIWIAEKHGVNWEAMLLANERYLKQKYGEVCGRLSRRYRKRPRGKGHYCNERFFKPYGNTLQPGWKLKIPPKEAPKNIDEIVGSIQGNRVALVIDDTGSMTEDRERVGQFYIAALRKHKKQLTGVWLYADGSVRKYESGGVRFQTDGVFENTHGALTQAAREKPNSIVLITDEPGDDWDWFNVPKLPPVVAHCLRDHGSYRCEENLQRLVESTNGRYIHGL